MSRKSKNKPALPARPAAAGGRSKIFGACVFLAAIVGAVFGPALRHGFINFDDGPYVYENPEVREGLTPHGIAWAFTRAHSYNWHPLTWISHMLDCGFYGLNPAGHHFTNIALHAAAAALLFLVLRQMT